MDVLSGVSYGAQIGAAARAQGLDPRLLAAVAAQETGGPGASSGRNVVGDGGHGHGLFQIDDRSWAFAASPQAMDPAANASAAASILRGDLDRYGGNVRAALSAYNSGSPTATGTTTSWPGGQTLGYADSVLQHYAALGGDTATLAADDRDGASGLAALSTLGTALPAPSSTLGGDISGGSAASFPPPVVQVDSQSPFAPPISWANETSANGPAGGKLAADADGLVASSIDASDDVFDDRSDA